MSSQSATAPIDGAQPRVSFFVDDLPDAPIGPGEAVGWYQLVDDGEYYLLDPFDWPQYFVISAPLTAPQLTSEPAPDGAPSLHSPVPSPIDPSTIEVAAVAQVKPSRGSVVTTGLFSLPEIIDSIRTSDRLRLETEKGRALALEHGRKSDQYKSHKLGLPGFLPSMSAPVGTAAKGLSLEHHSGLYAFDLDEFRPIPIDQMREELLGTPGCVAFGVSLGGDGMWAILAGPVAATEEEHKANWIAVARHLPPTAKANNAASSKNSNRLRVMCYDPDAWLATEPVHPLAGGTPEDLAKTTRRAEKSAKRATADPGNISPLTERETTLLGDLPVPQEYNHWLGWITTLKAVGFTCEEVEQWSTAGEKYRTGEVADRWDSLNVDPPTEARARFRKAVGGGLVPLTEAGFSNMNDVSNFHRLAHFNAEKLVIALPAPADGPDTPADIYGIDAKTGILSHAEFAAAVLRTGRYYLASAFCIGDQAEFREVASHARKLRDAGAPERLRRVAAGAISEQREFDAIPAELVVKNRDDIDSDLSVIGTPSGVLNLRTGEILPPTQARDFFIVSCTGVDYDPRAQHGKVDEILPPAHTLTDDSVELYRARIVAFGMLHRPRREFLWEICARGSGKTSFVNALRQGLGSDYIRSIRREALMLAKYHNGSTSHSGDLRHFRQPARFVFVSEMKGNLDSDLLKRLSGGDVVDMRRIHREDESFQPTAHLWVQGNTRTGTDSPSLGLAEDDEDSLAILDRAKMLKRETLTQQDPAVVLLDTHAFKAAALARVVEYCKIFGGLEFPETIPALASLLDDQKAQEVPPWKTEWLPQVLVPLDDNQRGAVANNKSTYEDFTHWWEMFGEGRPPSTRTIGRAVCDHYQVSPQQTTIIDPQARDSNRYCRAYKYPGFKLRD